MPKYEVRAQITGTRNGQDWPKVGEEIDLPTVEAADYVAAGYVVEAAVVDTKPQPRKAPRS